MAPLIWTRGRMSKEVLGSTFAGTVNLEHVQPDWNRSHARVCVPKHPLGMIHRPPVLAPRRCACFGNVAKPIRRIFGWHRHITLSMFALASLAVIRKGAVGGRGANGPDGGVAAAHRAGGQAPAGASVPSAKRARSRPTMVQMAKTTSAACPTRTLAPTTEAR
jgi:hypothetical protein